MIMRKFYKYSMSCSGLAIALLSPLTGFAYGPNGGQNVIQPGDPLIGSSANTPASEGPANAIDGTQAKYLNFDAANNAKPVGFVVTPSVGVTWVTGISMQSANDSPDRDPLSITIEGSNDATITNFTSGNWTLIYANANIPAWTAIYTNANDRYAWQTFQFTNYTAFTHYRWTVLTTQGNAGVTTGSGCCMQTAEVELLGEVVPKNVVQPGDPLIGSSANTPASEGPANAIDGTQAKYLNFDAANNAKPVGFVVTPSVGPSVVVGITMESANDSPDRDPLSITIEGSNDDSITNFTSGNWTTIYANANIPAWTVVYPNGNDRYGLQTFLFNNYIPYKSYRWTVLKTQGNTGVTTGSGCCMQIAEVELLGSGAPKDVCQPGDPLIGSSANTPASEGPANAIDGTQAKYLNFDAANNAKPVGFVVTPSVGATTITGITMESANDSPDRDPLSITIEGSNDASVTNFSSGNWTLIYANANIPAWTAIYTNSNDRYALQTFYFPNSTPYTSYRWTVLKTQGNTGVATGSGCCMQIAEVQLLAVTSQNDCSKAAFIAQPANTPVLLGSQATFISTVNGPWTLQWYENGAAIPGANKPTYTSDVITTSNVTNIYTVAITGCSTSAPVMATIFTPSTVSSIGLKFTGGGANGTPNYINFDDIAGVQAQAYWMNATNTTDGGGANIPVTLNDSSNNASAITLEYTTSGTWGAGVGTDTPTERLLNGIAGTGTVGTPYDVIFHSVPAGNYSVLLYTLAAPGNFATAMYWVSNILTMTASSPTYYVSVMNSDQYKPAPGFYRGTSTNVNAPSVADFVRFDNVKPDANGDLDVFFQLLVSGVNNVGLSAIQLLANPPAVGAPPAITQQPLPTVGPAGGTVELTVVAAGNGLTYQWRKNGKAVQNVGDVSGAATSTLMIKNLSPADEAIYSVAVFNAAGSTVSENASVYISAYNIQSSLLSYFKFDETTGTLAANSASNGLPAYITTTGAAPLWTSGKVAGAMDFEDSVSYGIVSNYTKPVKAISAAAWVNLSSIILGPENILRNGEGALQVPSSGNTPPVGQFDFRFTQDTTDNTLHLDAELQAGSTFPEATETTPFTPGVWTHVAFTADGAQLRLYRNGQQVAVKDYNADLLSPTVPFLAIGARLNTNDTDIIMDTTTPSPLIGQIDELALWGRALTVTEIGQLYAAGLAGKALTTIVETPPVSTPPTLTVIHSSAGITVTWDHGTLQTAPAITGPWTDQTSATSPMTEPASGKLQFFRAYIKL